MLLPRVARFASWARLWRAPSAARGTARQLWTGPVCRARSKKLPPGPPATGDFTVAFDFGLQRDLVAPGSGDRSIAKQLCVCIGANRRAVPSLSSACPRANTLLAAMRRV